MAITVRNLILEVTRKCNMVCGHCLRGKAQNIDMSNDIIDMVFSQIGEIGNITFTGGEPTLNMKAIEYFTNTVIEKSYPLQSFWMATNAKEYSPKLVTTLLDLYDYCMEYSGEEGMCGLAVSQDKFHDATNLSALRKYNALSFYDSSKEIDFNKASIINEGYAYENGIGTRELREEELSLEFYDDEIIVEQLYINAKGDVLVECDYSYESQEEMKIGNIMEESLLNILRRAQPETFEEDLEVA